MLPIDLEELVADALAQGDLQALRAATRALRAADALYRRREAMAPRGSGIDPKRIRELLHAVRDAEKVASSKVEASETAIADVVDASDVARLLDAARLGEAHVRLDVEVERLVAGALAGRERHVLRAASLALRVYERMAVDGGRPVPSRVTALLAEVRAAMRPRKEAT